MRFGYKQSKSFKLMKKFNSLQRTTLFQVSSKKIFRIMKLSTFLLFVTVINVLGSKTYSQQGEFQANTSIKDALNNRQILLANKEESAALSLQQNRITGIVTDKNGSPVPGVNVVVTGTTVGALTDIAGYYSIEVPQGSKSLTFSFIGMESKEVSIGSLTQINVNMAESAIGLEEVVVVGYGTQKKVNLTGSLSTVSVKELEDRPITNVSSALQGTMAGVTVTVNSGQPGKNQGLIRVRGVGTLGNSDAMVMVDGIVSSLNDLNPGDIETITVLKDAASVAIYGSRASNGVILITTKKAKKGDIIVHYNMYLGQQKPTALPNYLPSWQAASLQNEALISENKSPAYTDAEIQKFKDGSDPDRYANTDWLKLFYKGTGIQQNHYLDISGGNEKSQNLLSLGYFSEAGIVKNTGLTRYTTRFKNSSTLGSHVTLNGTLAYTFEDFKEPTSPYNNNFSDFVWQINKTGRNVPYKTSNGYYGYGTDGNPIAWLESGALNKVKYHYLTGVAEGDLEIVKGLHFKPLLGYNLRISQSKNRIKDIQYYNYTTGEPTWVQGPNKLFQNVTDYTIVTLQALLQYNRTIGKHEFTALGGYSQEYSKYNLMSAYRYGFLNNELNELDAGPINGQTNSGLSTEAALESFFGRINYAFNTRYLFEANIRYDGSSRFSPENRWSVYPSFSAGWRISEEAFFTPLKGLLTDLKIRGSWGMLGNQEVGSNYPYQYTIAPGQNYTFGGVVANGMAPLAGANSGIKWEDTKTTDFGLDAVFLDGKITFTGDYFIRKTSNILLRIPVASTFGFNAPVVNAGSVQNTGIELTLGYHMTKQNFTFDVLANASFIENKVTDLAGTDPIIGGYTFMKVGYPINSFYGYECEGIFQNQGQVENHATQSGGVIAPGDLMYKDQIVNGVADGEIDGNDRVYLGTYFPKVTYGLNLSAGWKGFDVTMFLQGTAGVKGFVRGELIGKLTGSEGKPTEVFLDHWTTENPTNEFPRLWNSYTNNDPSSNCSSFWVRNAGYMRLKDLTVGYTLPVKLTSKAGIQNAKIYWSGKDILTFTQFYKWVDPEAPAGESGYTYPKVMVNVIGINLTF
jgi:TonB-linked SusC/RagA family outer membrane protein